MFDWKLAVYNFCKIADAFVQKQNKRCQTVPWRNEGKQNKQIFQSEFTRKVQ